MYTNGTLLRWFGLKRTVDFSKMDFKKIDTKLFVIISSSTFAYGLDLYLFYITFLTFVFFWVWTYLIVKLNKFHSKLPWLKKANFI